MCASCVRFLSILSPSFSLHSLGVLFRSPLYLHAPGGRNERSRYLARRTYGERTRSFPSLLLYFKSYSVPVFSKKDLPSFRAHSSLLARNISTDQPIRHWLPNLWRNVVDISTPSVSCADTSPIAQVSSTKVSPYWWACRVWFFPISLFNDGRLSKNTCKRISQLRFLTAWTISETHRMLGKIAATSKQK